MVDAGNTEHGAFPGNHTVTWQRHRVDTNYGSLQEGQTIILEMMLELSLEGQRGMGISSGRAIAQRYSGKKREYVT